MRTFRAVLFAAAFLLLPASPASAAPGDLDPTFGEDGIVLIRDGAAIDVAVDANGGIVVLEHHLGKPFVTRLTPEGDIDDAFHGMDVPIAAVDPDGGHILFDEEGRIIVALRDRVVRLLPDGQPDATFGAAGTLLAPEGVRIRSAAIDPFGRLLVGGSRHFDDSAWLFDGVVFRYQEDGSVDPTFGEVGSVRISRVYGANDIETRRRGGVLIATGTHRFERPAVVALRPDGRLTRRFGTNGLATTGEIPRCLEWNSAGMVEWQPGLEQIVIGGTMWQDRDCDGWGGSWVVSAFDGRGEWSGGFRGVGASGIASDMQVDRATVLVVGKNYESNPIDNGPSYFAIARLLPDLTQDPSFGGGLIRTRIRPDLEMHEVLDQASALALGDGRIVVVGASWYPGGSESVVVAYQAA